MSDTNKCGRKPKYSKVGEVQPLIDDYYAWCLENEKPMTFAGLAYALGFSRRQTLNDYVNKDNDVSAPIKRAMLRIEQDYEEDLRGKAPTGSIFALKNRGWSDKQEVNYKVKLSVIDELREKYQNK